MGRRKMGNLLRILGQNKMPLMARPSRSKDRLRPLMTILTEQQELQIGTRTHPCRHRKDAVPSPFTATGRSMSFSQSAHRFPKQILVGTRKKALRAWRRRVAMSSTCLSSTYIHLRTRQQHASRLQKPTQYSKTVAGAYNQTFRQMPFFSCSAPLTVAPQTGV